MNRIVHILSFCLFFTSFMTAQQVGVCGYVPDQAQIDRTLAAKAAMSTYASDRTTTYVPIKFHLIGKNDGSFAVLVSNVLDQLCSLNEFCAEYDIVFYIKDGFNYINSNFAYDDHAEPIGQNILAANRDNKALNVYIPNDANTGGAGPPGTTLGYYSGAQGEDWVVVKKSEINGFSTTLAHEVGHYFSVQHPFLGWDHDPYEESIHGNPVNIMNSPTHPTIPIEVQNGSNCNIAGDFLCDTPPDYLFALSSSHDGDCDFDAGIMDKNGDVVDPDETNIMTYFDDSCGPKHLSNQQVGLINADYNMRAGFSLENNHTPNTTAITEIAQLESPINGMTTPQYNAVAFNWADVPGADSYLLEIDIFSTFNLSPERYIVEGSYTIIEDIFNPGATYYWRVRPYNETAACTDFSATGNFVTGDAATAVQEIEFVNSFEVLPNPAQGNSEVSVQLHSEQAFDADVKLYNISGQLLSTNRQHFAVGESNYPLPLNGLQSGLYIITVESAYGLINKKLVVN